MCSTYGGSTSGYTVYTVGAGTSYPNSSNLPSTSLSSVKLLVIGDFTINNNFVLSNSLVKVNPGLKISIDVNWVSSYSLYLSNTKIFACPPSTGTGTKLWKGIELNSFTSITVTNNSEIEDAEDAIKAINTAFAGLYIDNSTFNRNKIAINLDNTNSTGWLVVPPTLTYFVNNKFTCTSPINGTTDDYTDVGVRMKGISYPFAYNYGNSHNEFRDLDFGMDIQGTGYTNMGIDYYRFVNIKNTCLKGFNIDNLEIRNSNFQNIEQFGLQYLFSRALLVQNSTFSIANRNYVTLGRIMIDMNPKYDSPNNVINILDNEFYFSGTLGSRSEGVRMQTNGFPNVAANIRGNSFKQYNEFGNSLEPNIGWSIGLNVGGNYSPSSNVSIEHNAFILDANNDRPVPVPNFPYFNSSLQIGGLGMMNNVKVIANLFKSGKGDFCGMSGNSSGLGNEFSSNTTILGGNGYFAGTFLGLSNFENLKICSNIDNFACDGTYFFTQQNNNMDFRGNTTYGGYVSQPHSLWITRHGLIGTQVHKGNRWYPIGTSIHPIIEHADPLEAVMSRFTVHTNQSVLSNNGNYSFFSEYFPSQIIPNNGSFFVKATGTPNTACVTQSPSAAFSIALDPVVDQSIADGTFNRTFNNTAYTLDAQLHLQRKLKKNGNINNIQSSLKEFYQKNELGNIGKLIKLEQAFEDNQNIDDIKKNKIQGLRNKIEDLEKEMKKYTSTKRPNQDEMKQHYKDRLELDMAISDLYKDHKNEKKIIFKKLKADVDNITTSSVQERYYKEVYQIYIEMQLSPNEEFTSEQINRLKKIASICSEEAGKIVYFARGILPQHELVEVLKVVEDCEKLPARSEKVRLANSDDINTQSINEITNLYPNPTNGDFNINIPKTLTAQFELYDISGHLMKSLKLSSGNNFIKNEVPQGIYIAKIKTSDGDTKSIKLIVKD